MIKLAKLERYKFYFLVLFIWAISSAAKLKFNGLVFGFDYGIYQPDGKFYTYMALDWINRNPWESANQVVDWYAIHGFKMNVFRPEDLMPNTSYAYPVISHRVLYPLLSVPFVVIFGIPGMLAIPVISFALLLICVQKISIMLKEPWLGVAMVVILSSSPTVLRWMIVNCTDSLLAGLFALLPLILMQIERRIGSRTIFLIGFLILLTSATRFVLPIWLGVALVLFFRSEKIFGIFVAIWSLITAIPALIAQVPTALLPGEQEISTARKLFELPWSFIKVVGIDVLEFAVLDRILLLVLLMAVLISALKIKAASSQYFIATLISTYTIGAINGTLGVNFRYQMPLLIFCAWVIIDNVRVQRKYEFKN